MSDSILSGGVVYSGLSQRQVASTHQVSRNTIALLLRHAKAQGILITLEDLREVDETQ